MGDKDAAAQADTDVNETHATHSRRNHVLGVLSGTVGQMGMGFLDPELILAGLIYALTGSTYLVALVATISKVGALGPQLLVGGFVEHKPRKMPSYVALMVIRVLGYALLIASMWLMTRGVMPLALTLFFASYLGVCSLGGASHVVSMDMVGRMIPHHRVGRFLGLRSFLGGTLSGVAGLVIIHPVLGGVRFPLNYVLLAAVGAVLVLGGMAVFSRAREEDGPQARRRTTLAESLRRGWRWLKEDHNYRCYFWLRIAFRINYLALAFFIPYGQQKLAAGGDIATFTALGGIMVAVLTLSRVVASYVWGRIIDRHGFRLVLTCAGAGFILAPVLALTAPQLPGTFEVTLPGTHTTIDLPMCVYLLALGITGMTRQASVIGGQHFLIRTAPPHRRVSYWGFSNTITSPLTLLPFLGAWIARRFDMTTLFGGVVLGGLLYLVTALRMRPVKTKPEA